MYERPPDSLAGVSGETSGTTGRPTSRSSDGGVTRKQVQRAEGSLPTGRGPGREGYETPRRGASSGAVGTPQAPTYTRDSQDSLVNRVRTVKFGLDKCHVVTIDSLPFHFSRRSQFHPTTSLRHHLSPSGSLLAPNEGPNSRLRRVPDGFAHLVSPR